MSEESSKSLLRRLLNEAQSPVYKTRLAGFYGLLKLAAERDVKIFDKNSTQVLVSSVSSIWKSREPGRHATGYCALSVLYLIVKNPTLLNFDATTSKRVLVRSLVLHIDRSVKDEGNYKTESNRNNASEEVLCLKLLVKNGLLHVVSDHIKMTVEYCKSMKSSEGSHPWSKHSSVDSFLITSSHQDILCLLITKITQGVQLATENEHQDFKEIQVVLETSSEKIMQCLSQAIVEGPATCASLQSEELAPMSDEKAVACLIRNLRGWKLRKQQKQIKELMDKNRARIQLSTFLKKQNSDPESSSKNKENDSSSKTQMLKARFNSRLRSYLMDASFEDRIDLKDKAARCLYHFLFNSCDESLLEKFLNTVGPHVFQEGWKKEQNIRAQYNGLCLFEALCDSRKGVQKMNSIGSLTSLLEVMIKYTELVSTESEVIKNVTGAKSSFLEMSLSARASIGVWGICKAVANLGRPRFEFTFSTVLATDPSSKNPELPESVQMRESILSSVLELLNKVMNSESNELSMFIIKTLTSAICTLLRDRDCILSVLCPTKSPIKLSSISPRLGDSSEETPVKERAECNKQNGLLLPVVDKLLDSSDTGVVQGAIGIVGTIAEMFSPLTDADQSNTLRLPPLPIVHYWNLITTWCRTLNQKQLEETRLNQVVSVTLMYLSLQIYEDFLSLKNSEIKETDCLDELSIIGASFSVLDQLLRTSKEESKIYLATTIWSLARCLHFQEKLGEAGIIPSLVEVIREWFDLEQFARIEDRKIAEWALAALCILCSSESNHRFLLESWKADSSLNHAMTSIKTFGYRGSNIKKSTNPEKQDFVNWQLKTELECRVGHDELQSYSFETEDSKRRQELGIVKLQGEAKANSRDEHFEDTIRKLVESHKTQESASDPLELLIQITQIRSRKESKLSSTKLLSLRILHQLANSYDGRERISKSSAVSHLVKLSLDSSFDAESRATAASLWLRISTSLLKEEDTLNESIITLFEDPSQDTSTLSDLVTCQIHLEVVMMKSGHLVMEVVGARAAANTLAESPCNQDYFLQNGHLQVVLDLLKKQDFGLLASCCSILFSLCKLTQHQHYICQEVLNPLLDINHKFTTMMDNSESEQRERELSASIVFASSTALETLLQNPENRDLFFKAELKWKALSNLVASSASEDTEFQKEGFDSHYQKHIHSEEMTHELGLDSEFIEDLRKPRKCLSFEHCSNVSLSMEQRLMESSAVNNRSNVKTTSMPGAAARSHFLRTMRTPVHRLWNAEERRLEISEKKDADAFDRLERIYQESIPTAVKDCLYPESSILRSMQDLESRLSPLQQLKAEPLGSQLLCRKVTAGD